MTVKGKKFSWLVFTVVVFVCLGVLNMVAGLVMGLFAIVLKVAFYGGLFLLFVWIFRKIVK